MMVIQTSIDEDDFPVQIKVDKTLHSISIHRGAGHFGLHFTSDKKMQSFVKDLFTKCAESRTAEELAAKIIDEHSEQESIPLP